MCLIVFVVIFFKIKFEMLSCNVWFFVNVVKLLDIRRKKGNLFNWVNLLVWSCLIRLVFLSVVIFSLEMIVVMDGLSIRFCYVDLFLFFFRILKCLCRCLVSDVWIMCDVLIIRSFCEIGIFFWCMIDCFR